VTVLDAFAVIALLRAEPAAVQVQQLIEAGGAELTAVGIAEVLDHLVRIVGTTDEEAALDLAQLGLDAPAPLDADTALEAGLVRAEHYHRVTRAVSLADCVAAATARRRATALATSDPHLLELCRDESIASIALPDSRGVTWSASRSTP
jgi:PIN domain nuclease of toxin-antitoxin system